MFYIVLKALASPTPVGKRSPTPFKAFRVTLWRKGASEMEFMCSLHIYISIYGTALGTPTPPPRGWSWFPAPPPVGVGGVVVDGWECWLMES